MVYNGLLYLEKSKLDTDGTQRLADEATARDWRDKALATRKKAQAQQAPSPSKT